MCRHSDTGLAFFRLAQSPHQSKFQKYRRAELIDPLEKAVVATAKGVGILRRKPIAVALKEAGAILPAGYRKDARFDFP